MSKTFDLNKALYSVGVSQGNAEVDEIERKNKTDKKKRQSAKISAAVFRKAESYCQRKKSNDSSISSILWKGQADALDHYAKTGKKLRGTEK